MKKVPQISIVTILTLISFLFPFILLAQCDTTGVGGDPQAIGCPLASDVPFDGGISVLVASAIGYGITKMKKKKVVKVVE